MVESVIDRARCDTLLRAPALGPNLLFFSGGTALRPLSRQLKRYTHNSIHLITPFDSGGSSAEIRRAFNMLAVGDLRNRLLALADESVQANSAIYRLFSYRLPQQCSEQQLLSELLQLASASHEKMTALPDSIRKTVRQSLAHFASLLPRDFNLRGANIGNLLITSAYLSHDCDIAAALWYFSQMLLVRGVVAPSCDADAHLAAVLRNGTRLIGQHRITGREVAPIDAPIEELFITRRLSSQEAVSVSATSRALSLICSADLICYSYGSFYSSVVANLLPQGIGRAVASVSCPKIYVPNWGKDPEQLGMTLADTVERLIHAVRTDAPDAAVRDVVRTVLIDSKNLKYALPLDVERCAALGIQIVDLPFATKNADGEIDFTPLAETLLSLS
ncbi:MAG TPA: GAK system CofD-like protein [Polyangiaceae bacterium]|nr:GAK system CofD-like protein [Polyangiaceae bacterium]